MGRWRGGEEVGGRWRVDQDLQMEPIGSALSLQYGTTGRKEEPDGRGCSAPTFLSAGTSRTVDVKLTFAPTRGGTFPFFSEQKVRSWIRAAGKGFGGGVCLCV